MLQPTWRALVVLLSAVIFASTLASAISTSDNFPQDIFARPAFHVQRGDVEDTRLLPIRNHTAVALFLEQRSRHRASLSRTPHQLGIDASTTSDSSLAVSGGASSSASDNKKQENVTPLSWFLHRTSPSSIHLCAIPDFTASTSSNQVAASSSSYSTATPSSRRQLTVRALALLEPLKQKCLFYTFDWFTYSFCHGHDIRQFRSLTPQSAADAAKKRAGGGLEGDKAAVKAAADVVKSKTPLADPNEDAFTLGRWKPYNDLIVNSKDARGGDASRSNTPTSATKGSKTDADSVAAAVPSSLATGTELVEIVQFGDWDEEELHAAESQMLARLSASENSAQKPATDLNRQRYISQTWSDGTLCDLNNQPRTIEIQFHCSPHKASGDRIVMVKETTICNYVLVVETSRLCSEPAFRGDKEEKAHQIQCHKVVRDDWEGQAYGEGQPSADDSQPPSKATTEQDTLTDGKHPAEVGTTSKSSQPKQPRLGKAAAPNGSDKRLDTSSESETHTYGDMSQYNSVHDDFYDEALGKHGAGVEFEDEDGNPLPPDSEGKQSKNTYFYIGVDENGQFVVDKLGEDNVDAAVQDTARTDSEGVKESSNRAAKPRNKPAKRTVDLTMNDADLVKAFDEQGLTEEFENKLIKSIKNRLNALRKKPNEGDAPADGNTRDQKAAAAEDDVAAMYRKLLKALDQDPLNIPPPTKQGQGTEQPDNFPRSGRMEKVGDTLPERAKRFYDAQERKQEDEEQELSKHVEL